MERQRQSCKGSNGNEENDDDVVLDLDLDIEEGRASISNTNHGLQGFIQHPVSKLDTLAGIAIKYGVQVSDIKKLNGLVTDLQMFARKTLTIPHGGRHPASSSTTTTTGNISSPDEQLDLQHSLTNNSTQRKASPTGNSLQGFYRINPTEKKTISDDFHVAENKNGASNFSHDSAWTHQPLSPLRKTRSLVDIILSEIDEQPDSAPGTPVTLLKGDNSSSCGFPSRTGQGLALRQKAASRTSSTADLEAGGSNFGQTGLEDTIQTDGPLNVRKSLSTSCLCDEGSNPTPIWPTSKWSLTPDFQAFAVAKPMFDGLPKPTTGRRNKAQWSTVCT